MYNLLNSYDSNIAGLSRKEKRSDHQMAFTVNMPSWTGLCEQRFGMLRKHLQVNKETVILYNLIIDPNVNSDKKNQIEIIVLQVKLTYSIFYPVMKTQ